MEKVTDIVDSGGGGTEVLSSLPESLNFDLDVQKEKPTDLGMIDSDILEFANQVGEEMDTSTDEANIASELSFLEGSEEKETGAIDVRDDPGLAFLVGESTKVDMNGEDLEFLEGQELAGSDYEYEEDSEDEEESDDDEDDDDESEGEGDEEGGDGEEQMEGCEEMNKERDIKTEDDDGDFGQVSFYDAEPDSKSSMDDIKVPKKKTEKGKKRKGKKRRVAESDGVAKTPKKKKRRKIKKKKSEGEDGEGEEDEDENVPKAGTRRRNIRSIMSEKDLDKDMLSAQQEELERQKRLMELKQSRLKESAAAASSSATPAMVTTSSTTTQATEMKPASASTDISSPKEKDSQLKSLLQVAEEEAEKEAESKERKQIDKEVIKVKKETRETSPPSDVITLSSDSDESDDVDSDSDGVLVVPSDEDEEYEEENEDLNNGGSHIDDNLNLPDSDGRVKINIGHPSDDPDVYLAPQIAQAIKPHQIGGVRFLYDNLVESLERFRTSPGFGCILAHSMGLGKTIQLISFIDIFIRCTGGKTVLCIVPINTLQNWLAEFNYWLPDKEKLLPDDDLTQFRVFPLYLINDSMKTTAARAAVVAKWKVTGGALIIGYEMFRLLSSKKVLPSKKTKSRAKKNSDTPEVIDVEEEDKNKVLMNDMHSAMVDPGPDLVMCDEGHRIKNSSAAISQALKNIKTKRRVVLTGYPLQNNLMEYWCMVDFVRPSFLGTKTEFSNMFERPIMNGQCVDSTAQDKKVMRHRSYVLHNLLEGFVQRRGHTVLQVNLPRKSEHVFLVRLSPIQRKIYCEFMNAISESGLCSWANNNPLKAFAVCCKIWNHPDVLHDVLTQRNLDKDNDLDIDTGDNVNSKKKSGGPKSKAASRSKAPPPSLQQQTVQQQHMQQQQQPPMPQQHLQPPMYQQQMQPFQQQMQQPLQVPPHLQQHQSLQQMQQQQQQQMPQPLQPLMSQQPLMSSAMNSAMANYPPIAPSPAPSAAPGLPPPPPPPPPPQLPPPQSLPASISTSTTSSSSTSSSTTTSADPPTPALTPSSSTTSLTSMASETNSEKNPVTYDWAEGVMKDYIAGVIENSGKMVLMKAIIEECLAVGDKVLVFSQSLLTLNKIEEFMGRCPVPRPELYENWSKNRTYFRLDGSTSALDREKLINQFNDPEGIAWMFLLSTKAGCLGINLVGANRVIVVDASWNPCHDCQAVCRVYRFGQVKNTYVYRLVTDNTLEKRIYDRQISKQGMSDRIIDDMNVENKFTRRQVENLLDFEDQDFPIQDFSNADTKYSQDQVLVRVLHNNGKWLTKQPFTHESLLIDRKEMRLSKREKRLAKEGYARDKRMNVSYTRPSYAAYYPQHGGLPNRLPLNSRYNYAAFRRGPIVRPIASVRPIIAASAQSGAEKIKQFGGQPLRPGVTIHQVITTTEIVLPGTNTGTQAGAATSNKIAAGQKILVIKTPKGVYIRTNDGKMFAVRSKTPGIGGLDSMASTGSAITTTTLSSTGGQVILSSGISATTVAAAAGGKKPPIIIVSNKKGMPLSMTRGGSIIRTLPYGSADLLSSLRSNISLVKAKSGTGSESTSTTSATSLKSSVSVKKGSLLDELMADDDDNIVDVKDEDSKDKGDGKVEKKTMSDGSTQSTATPKMPVIVLPSLGVRTPRPPSKQPPPSSTHAVQSGSTVVIMPTKPVVSMGTRRPPKNPKKKPNKSSSSDFDLGSSFDNNNADASKKKGVFSLLPSNSNTGFNSSVSVGTEGNNSNSSSVGVGGDGSSISSGSMGDSNSASSSTSTTMSGRNSQGSDNPMGGPSMQPANSSLMGPSGGGGPMTQNQPQQQQQPSSGSNEGFPDLNRMWQANFGSAPQQQQQQHLPPPQQHPMGGMMSHGGGGGGPMGMSSGSYLGGSNNNNPGMFGGVGNPNQQQSGSNNTNSSAQSNNNNNTNSISNSNKNSDSNNPNNANYPTGFSSNSSSSSGQAFDNNNSSGNSNNNTGNGSNSNVSGNNSTAGNNSIPPNTFQPQQQPGNMFGSGGMPAGAPMMQQPMGHSQPYNMPMMPNFLPSFHGGMAPPPHMHSTTTNQQQQPAVNNPMMFSGPQNQQQQQYAVNNSNSNNQHSNPNNPNPSPTASQPFGSNNMGPQMNNPGFQQPGAPTAANQQSTFSFPPVSASYGGGLVNNPNAQQPPPSPFMPHNPQQQSMMGGSGDQSPFSSMPPTSSSSNSNPNSGNAPPPYNNNPPQHTGFGIDQLTSNANNSNTNHFSQNQQQQPFLQMQQQSSHQQPMQTPSRPASNSNHSTPSSTPTLSVPTYPDSTNRPSSTATPDSSKRDNSPYSLTVLGGATDSSKAATTESSSATSKSKRNNKSSSKSKNSHHSSSSSSSSSLSSANLDNKNSKNSHSATSLTIPNFSSSSSPLNNPLSSVLDNNKLHSHMNSLNNSSSSALPISNSGSNNSLNIPSLPAFRPFSSSPMGDLLSTSSSTSSLPTPQSLPQQSHHQSFSNDSVISSGSAFRAHPGSVSASGISASPSSSSFVNPQPFRLNGAGGISAGGLGMGAGATAPTLNYNSGMSAFSSPAGTGIGAAAAAAAAYGAAATHNAFGAYGSGYANPGALPFSSTPMMSPQAAMMGYHPQPSLGYPGMSSLMMGAPNPAAPSAMGGAMWPMMPPSMMGGAYGYAPAPAPPHAPGMGFSTHGLDGQGFGS